MSKPKEKPSPPVAADVDVLPELQDNHYEWILAAAHRDFAETVAELESELLRCKLLDPDLPLWSKHGRDPKKRSDRMVEIERRIAEYGRILEFLRIARTRLLEKSAENWAAMIVPIIKERWAKKG